MDTTRMHHEKNVSLHYKNPGLLKSIENGLLTMGKRFDQCKVDDLASVDELHIGGRKASENLLRQLDLSPNNKILDIGCGFGGTSRFAASRYSVSITGIDLSQDFINTGNELCAILGLKDKVRLHHGSATSIPFQDEYFDGAYMMHVGMNIKDKRALFSEIFKKLRHGKMFGIYDVMQTGPGSLSYPVPWAESSEICAISTLETYKDCLNESGFKVVSVKNKRQFSLDYFAEQKIKMEQEKNSHAIGLHLVMGNSMKEKMKNIINNIQKRNISPIEIIALKI